MLQRLRTAYDVTSDVIKMLESKNITLKHLFAMNIERLFALFDLKALKNRKP